MAPSFVDSRRNARMGLGLNLGGCCSRISDVRHHYAVKIVPIPPRQQQQQQQQPQEHANPLFVRSDEENPAIEQRPRQPSPSPSPRRIQPQSSPRSSPRSSPLVIPEFPFADDEDENGWGGFLSPAPGSASPDSLSSSSWDPDLDHQRLEIFRWKGVDLPVYEGQWDADAIEEWVSKMDGFFQICGPSMSEQEKIDCAVFHLSGAAHKIMACHCATTISYSSRSTWTPSPWGCRRGTWFSPTWRASGTRS
ncbi:hypothetical protein SELMODRAFT_412422 [Selaginella moellendorffii]|uniref:Uncharacterized protein n=1 Tax=Selaginella moellendorffii TaxID=88036 RepID=D8RL37_SELML|nr:hypothetical protein SELMODRAFT_412422 [Selaginella moellendorffii]